MVLSRRPFDEGDLGSACFLTWVILKPGLFQNNFGELQADSAETFLVRFFEAVVGVIAILYLQCLPGLSNIILMRVVVCFPLLFLG